MTLTRKIAKDKKEKLLKQLETTQKILDKTCKHKNIRHEDVSCGYDQFRDYRDFCKDCHKELKRY